MLKAVDRYRLKHPRLSLKSVWLWNRKQLPEKPGIYLLVSFWEVVYVGMSGNLNSRWNSTGFYTHHKLDKAKLLPLSRLYYLPLIGYSQEQVLLLEHETISHFKSKNQAKWNGIKEVSDKLIIDLHAHLGMVILALILSLLFSQLTPVWMITAGVYFLWS
ncbi:MAG: hypothetical protein WBG70_23410 [Spirulinaceae cyanobacterium]